MLYDVQNICFIRDSHIGEPKPNFDNEVNKVITWNQAQLKGTFSFFGTS